MKDKEIKMWLVIIILVIIILIIWFYFLGYQFSIISSKSSSGNYFKEYTNELNQIWQDFQEEVDALKEKKPAIDEEQLKKIEEKIKEYNQGNEHLE